MASDMEKGAPVPWGDVIDDGDDEDQMIPDDDNFTIVEEIKTNDKGQKVKVIRKIRKVRIVERVNKKALNRRRNWTKYGEAMDKTYEQTTSKGDIFQFQYEKVGKTEKRSLEDQIKKEVQDTLAKAGKTTTGAWTARRIQAEQEAAAAGAAGGMRAPGGARLPSAPGAYVPPNRARGGDDFPTIRVSNLSDDVQEHELGDLFARYGQVHRVRLLFDKITGQFKNIAFVTFYNRDHAETAMKKLEGVGLHHLIMQLEWAKPTTSYAGGADKPFQR